MIPDWQAAAFALLVAIPIVAALVTRVVLPHAFNRLPLTHVAAATIIASVGWESAIQVPGALAAFTLIGSGVSGVFLSNEQIVLASVVAFALTSFVAAFAILARRPWGVAMGLGVAVGGVGTAILSVLSTIANLSVGGALDDQLMWFVPQIALRGVPPLVAIGLLAWPLLRGRLSGLPSAPPMPPRRHEGIIDLDPDAGIEDWPELASPMRPEG
jgi:hypothetical protein